MADLIETNNLDFSDKVSITFSKVKFNGEFSHWEGDLIYDGIDRIGCTAPTLGMIIDTLIDYLYIDMKEWSSSDANKNI